MWTGRANSPVATVGVFNLPPNVTVSQMRQLFVNFDIIHLELVPPEKPKLAILTLSSEQFRQIYQQFNNKPPHFLQINLSNIPEQVKGTGKNRMADNCEEVSFDEDELEDVDSLRTGLLAEDDDVIEILSEPKSNENIVFCNKKLEEEISNEVMKNKSMNKDVCDMEDMSNNNLKRDIDEDIDGSGQSLIDRLTVINSKLSQERKMFRELKLKIETVLDIAEDIKLFITAERAQKVEKRDIIIVEELLGNLKIRCRNIESESMKEVLSNATYMIETSLLEAADRGMEVASAIDGASSKEDLEARWQEAREHLPILDTVVSKSLCTVDQILTDCRSWLGDWAATVLARQAHTANAKDLLSKEFDTYSVALGDISADGVQNVVERALDDTAANRVQNAVETDKLEAAIDKLEAAMDRFEEAAEEEMVYCKKWDETYLQRVVSKMASMLNVN